MSKIKPSIKIPTCTDCGAILPTNLSVRYHAHSGRLIAGVPPAASYYSKEALVRLVKRVIRAERGGEDRDIEEAARHYVDSMTE